VLYITGFLIIIINQSINQSNSQINHLFWIRQNSPWQWHEWKEENKSNEIIIIIIIIQSDCIGMDWYGSPWTTIVPFLCCSSTKLPQIL